MRARGFVFTWNNYPEEYSNDDTLDTWLHGLGGKYAIAGRETAPSTGTRHLQGYIYFKNARSLVSVRRLLPGCHVESARGTPLQSRVYCSKDGSFREVGDVPEDPGDREKQRWDDARAMAEKGSWSEIPSDIYIRYIGNLERIYRRTLPPLESLDETCGKWIVGPTGSGKSRGSRAKYPDLYPKPLNKWWDGYDTQETVLLDDVDDAQSGWIGNFLKIWADHYPFIAEMKGGSRLIRPKRIIVTSQYSIEHLFKEHELQSAILRRFNVINVTEGNEINWN